MDQVLTQTKFDILRTRLNPTELPISEASKEKAEDLLAKSDFPTRKNEAWKYTNVNGLNKLLLDGESSGFMKPHNITKSADKVYIVNGQVSKNKSDVPGIKTSWNSLSEMQTEDPFDALNLLYCTAALELTFEDADDKVIELVFENTLDTAIFPRIFIQCKKNAKGTVILNFQGAEKNASFINASTYVDVEENANLSIHKIQKNGAETFDLQREYVNQAANSVFTINTFPLSGRMTRNDLTINVNGSNCETFMNGAYTLKGKSHCDNHTTVDHKVAHCYSKELYKGVIDDRATNVFNGKVFVRKDAQKINAFQSNANILLSETGTVNSKPELEIYADDVKCSHGSTTGQLDDEAVFYLRSRGLSEKSAKELLVKAFLGEVLEEVENEEVSSYVEKQIEEHFSA
ncbi:MAG: Fe-S cluster assembly protein SufD [Crocinitomicaceae bacterium]|nr:Fe-S cluster assembly protein SufD [Crocinitomicaceae bacterium]